MHERKIFCSQTQMDQHWAWADHYLKVDICRSCGGLSANEQEEKFALNDNVCYLFFLDLLGYPRFITGPSDKVVAENSSVQFTCIIEGDPAPHVEWTTPSGTILTLLSQPSGNIRVLTNNSLSITMVTGMNAGAYTCTAVNGIGRQSISATLTVLGRYSTAQK